MSARSSTRVRAAPRRFQDETYVPGGNNKHLHTSRIDSYDGWYDGRETDHTTIVCADKDMAYIVMDDEPVVIEPAIAEEEEEEFDFGDESDDEEEEIELESDEEADANESDEDVESNRCLECGVDMGPQNPRQLCGKTYCRSPLDRGEESERSPDEE